MDSGLCGRGCRGFDPTLRKRRGLATARRCRTPDRRGQYPKILRGFGKAATHECVFSGNRGKATGWDRKGADLLSVLCRTDPDAPAERGISIILVECPTPGFVFERTIDSVGHRAHLLPQFALEGVSVPGDNVLGNLGGGLALTAACFMGAAALVGIFAVGVMRMGFDFALGFARNERR